MSDPKSKLALGQKARLTIEALAYGGDGVGHLDGMTVFVPFSAPGDEVEIQVGEVHKSYARARILRVTKPAPERVEPPCPVAGKCGGCSWQHLSYQAQLAAKQDFVLQSLQRLGKLESIPLRDIVPADPVLYYRNKAQVPVGHAGTRLQMGFYAAGTHRIVPLPPEGCYIQPGLANTILAKALGLLEKTGLRAYDERSGQGEVRHLQVRVSLGGEAMLAFITRAEAPALNALAVGLMAACPGLVSVQHSIQPRDGNTVFGGPARVLAGSERLVEEVGGFRFALSAESFFQVHSQQLHKMWDLLLNARTWGGTEKVLELYCGIGTLSLPLARKAASVCGVEIEPKAVEDARFNAELNGIPNASFHAGAAEGGFKIMEREGARPDVLVLDPPRKGLVPEILQAILAAKPAEILYVSCDPSSLARDLGALVREGGYALQSVTPLDMFPQTYHVESISYLKRE